MRSHCDCSIITLILAVKLRKLSFLNISRSEQASDRSLFEIHQNKAEFQSTSKDLKLNFDLIDRIPSAEE